MPVLPSYAVPAKTLEDPKPKPKTKKKENAKAAKPKAAKPKAVRPKAAKPKAVKPKAVKPKAKGGPRKAMRGGTIRPHIVFAGMEGTRGHIDEKTIDFMSQEEILGAPAELMIYIEGCGYPSSASVNFRMMESTLKPIAYSSFPRVPCFFTRNTVHNPKIFAFFSGIEGDYDVDKPLIVGKDQYILVSELKNKLDLFCAFYEVALKGFTDRELQDRVPSPIRAEYASRCPGLTLESFFTRMEQHKNDFDMCKKLVKAASSREHILKWVTANPKSIIYVSPEGWTPERNTNYLIRVHELPFELYDET